MDNDLISKTALLERMCKDNCGETVMKTICVDAMDKCNWYLYVKNQPTVDAVEVVHGRWSLVKIGLGVNSISFAKCSACGRKMNVSHYRSLYCGLCGAKMDGGDK